MTDIDAIRQQVERYTGFAGSSQSFLAHRLAKQVPALLAKVDELTAKIERRRAVLVEAEADLLDVRGILSPNGFPRRVPVDLVPTVAPAVRWLADQVDELTADNERLRAEPAEVRNQAHRDATNHQQIVRANTELANERDALAEQNARLREIAQRYREVMVEQHGWAGHLIEGECAPCIAAAAEWDGDLACDEYKRWQQRYEAAIGMYVPTGVDR